MLGPWRARRGSSRFGRQLPRTPLTSRFRGRRSAVPGDLRGRTNPSGKSFLLISEGTILTNRRLQRRVRAWCATPHDWGRLEQHPLHPRGEFSSVSKIILGSVHLGRSPMRQCPGEGIRRRTFGLRPRPWGSSVEASPRRRNHGWQWRRWEVLDIIAAGRMCGLLECAICIQVTTLVHPGCKNMSATPPAYIEVPWSSSMSQSFSWGSGVRREGSGACRSPDGVRSVNLTCFPFHYFVRGTRC